MHLELGWSVRLQDALKEKEDGFRLNFSRLWR